MAVYAFAGHLQKFGRFDHQHERILWLLYQDLTIYLKIYIFEARFAN